MSQFGLGIIVKLLQDDAGVVPAYRWDKEGSAYYELRPDRWFPDMAQAYHWTFNYPGFLEFQTRFHVAEPSRGGGGPSALTQSPPSSSKPRRQTTRSSSSSHRRESCPKGHYWSYKHGKCMKSKYR